MFKITQHEEQPLTWWFQQQHNIEMDPPYQRDNDIWPKRDQAFLIDTIINDLDIPKLYLADFRSFFSPLTPPGKLYAVIDGKQRLGAIFKFLNGTLVLNHDIVFLKDPSIKLGGLSYKDLTWSYPDIARQVENYLLTVMSVITDEQKRISEIFIRLNRGERLTGAEFRNAMPGPVPVLVRALANHDFFNKNIRFDIRRGQAKNAAAKILLLEFREKPTDVKRANLDAFAEDADNAVGPTKEMQFSLFSEEVTDQNYQQAYTRATQVLETMTTVFTQRDPLLVTAGPLTLYYWFIRSLPAEQLPRFRTFLQEFHTLRLDNRRLAKDNPQNADSELLYYDRINRSPDDAGSLAERKKIMMGRFEVFLSSTPPRP